MYIDDETEDDTAEGFEYADEDESLEVEDDFSDEDEAEDADEEDEAAEVADEDDGADEADDSDSDSESPKKGKGDKDDARAGYKSRKRVRETDAENAKLREELARVNGRLDQINAAQAPRPPAEPEPEVEIPEFDYTDMEGSIDKRAAARELKAARKAHAEAESAWRELVQVSTTEAAQVYDDYEEVMQRYSAREAKNPNLAKLVRKQPDPGDWAYHNQKRHDSRTKAKTDETEELRAKVVELEGKIKGGKKKPPSRSLARARGAGTKPARNSGSTDRNSTFSDVFKRQKRGA